MSSMPDQQETSTLAQKLEVFAGSFEKLQQTHKELQEKPKCTAKKTPLFPLSDQTFCIICNMIRLNPEPTGLTCGDYKCLAALGQKVKSFNELEDGFKEEEERFQEERQRFKGDIMAIAGKIGIETLKPKKEGVEKREVRDLDSMVSDILGQLDDMADTLKSLEPLR